MQTARKGGYPSGYGLALMCDQGALNSRLPAFRPLLSRGHGRDGYLGRFRQLGSDHWSHSGNTRARYGPFLCDRGAKKNIAFFFIVSNIHRSHEGSPADGYVLNSWHAFFPLFLMLAILPDILWQCHTLLSAVPHPLSRSLLL